MGGGLSANFANPDQRNRDAAGQMIGGDEAVKEAFEAGLEEKKGIDPR
jgi:hypothetical protein